MVGVVLFALGLLAQQPEQLSVGNPIQGTIGLDADVPAGEPARGGVAGSALFRFTLS